MRPFNQGRHRRAEVFPQGIFSFSASMQAEIEARNNRELISSECAKPFHIPKGRAISFVVELDQCEYRKDKRPFHLSPTAADCCCIARQTGNASPIF